MTITLTREEAQQMLDAFKNWDARGRIRLIDALRAALAHPEKIECSRSHPHENMGSHCELRTEIARLTNENARLKAQPEPEPVAWLKNIADQQPRAVTDLKYRMACESSETWIPLYTTPSQREWVGLTSDDRIVCEQSAKGNYVALLTAIEQVLKEKNTCQNIN